MRVSEMTVLLDNGHGINTAGKCSPDLRVREYKYTRELADAIVAELREKGIDARLITPEDSDITISERCKRVNSICKDSGDARKVLLVSVHCNASGADGKWHSGHGWQVCVGMTASEASRHLATLLAEAAEKQKLHVRTAAAFRKYWVQSLGICQGTKCPAVLTENMFMDNKEDVEYLLSDIGRKTIVKLHVEGIINYIKSV